MCGLSRAASAGGLVVPSFPTHKNPLPLLRVPAAHHMASTFAFADKKNQILVEVNSHVKRLILNRPDKLNALNPHMIFQLLKELKKAETDPTIKLVIMKGEGKAFCVGGDVKSIINYVEAGHWTFEAQRYAKLLILNYVVATYKKPQVFLINGLVMGAGAGLSMFGRFKVVTEKAVFAMPEAAIGLFPDVGASYFLSRLPGFFGEYLGLTGARLDGSEMLACGLATHFVHSKNLPLLEDALNKVDITDSTKICEIINGHEERASLKKNSVYQRLDIINRCFSRGSVEEIISYLEYEAVDSKDEWINAAIKSIKMASPTILKLFLRSIREGRTEGLDECLAREYRMASHVMRKTVNGDFYEGVRSKLFDKGSRPKWEPTKLELVRNDLLDKYYTKVDEDEGWEELQLPCRSNPDNSRIAKL